MRAIILTITCLAGLSLYAATPALAVQSTPQPSPEKPQSTAATTTGAPYPGGVKQAFLRSCINNHEELINSCKCMILTFEKMVPLKDFEALAASDDPSRDPRFLKVTSACLRAQRQTQQ